MLSASSRRDWRVRAGLVAAIMIGLALRVAPVLATGMPFDNDSWYIHGDIRVLRRDPGARLLSDARYDGYNNYWPGSIIIPYTLTMTTGYTSLNETHLVGPLLDGLALIPFYTLARRLSEEKAWQATLLLATAPSMLGLDLGLVKETIARPLYYTTLLAAATNLPAATLPLATGLAMTHHLTSTITATILVAAPVMTVLLGISSGSRITGPGKTIVLYATLPVIVWLAVVPPASWKTIFHLFDPGTMILYMIAFTLLAPMGIALIGGRPGFASTWLPTIILVGLITYTALRGLSPGVQALDTAAIYYMAPVILLAPLVSGALARLKNETSREWSGIPYAWSFPLAGLVAYLTLTSPLGQSPAGRVANLILPGLILLYAYSGSRLLDWKALGMILVSILYLQALLSGGDPVAYDLPYHDYEYTSLQLATHATLPLYTDAKMRDPARYLGLEPVQIMRGPGNGILILYRENLRYGYKLDSNLHTGTPQEITPLLHADTRLLDTGKSWIILHQS